MPNNDNAQSIFSLIPLRK